MIIYLSEKKKSSEKKSFYKKFMLFFNVFEKPVISFFKKSLGFSIKIHSLEKY